MARSLFDRTLLHLCSLADRVSDMDLSDVLELHDVDSTPHFPALPMIGQEIRKARASHRPVVLLMGAHVIKRGLSRYVIDLMERGFLTHVAGNGACCIHDFELARGGATTESVARYLSEGQFGLWQETGEINDIVNRSISTGLGFGEAIGRELFHGRFPYRSVSILAAGCRLEIPVTIHVGIGQDIIHMHPNFDAAATGVATYRDFLTIAETLRELEGGVVLNFGTAVMGPEIFQKGLSMARNVASQANREIARFTTAVFDLIDIGQDHTREPQKDEASYYFRPFKTLLVRSVQDGGKSYYVRGDHRLTLPALRSLLLQGGEE